MEIISEVKSKSALQTREWQTQEGEKRTISFIEVVLSNGLDSIVAEATDRLAAIISNSDVVGKTFVVQLVFSVRSWKNKEGREVKANSVKIVNMGGL